MDDLEMEAAFASLDESRSTPADVAARIHARVLDEVHSTPDHLAGPILGPMLGDPDVGSGAATAGRRTTRRWLLAAGAVAAAVLVVLGVTSPREGTEETVVSGATLESECRQLAVLTDDFAPFSNAVGVEPWTAEDLAVVRAAVHDVVEQLRGDVDSAGSLTAWIELEFLIAQADRDARVGDLAAARRVLTQAQLVWAEIEPTNPPACRSG